MKYAYEKDITDLVDLLDKQFAKVGQMVQTLARAVDALITRVETLEKKP